MGAEIDLLTIDLPVLERAAALRLAHRGLRTPDAIHAATAIAAGCRLFVTNDMGFRQIEHLPLVLLSELSTP